MTLRTRFLLVGMLLTLHVAAQNYQASIRNYIDTFSRGDMHIGKPKLQTCEVDDSTQSIRITCSDIFGEQFFTEESVERVYRDIRRMLPDSLQSYTLTVITDKHAIEDLIPNAVRTRQKDDTRLWKREYDGAPWVKNLSRPYDIRNGLDGTHLTICQSHGRYYDRTKKIWKWMRPNLFCTTEDLFTQTFVLPYIIPMLENAGAIVYTARERDWQSHEVIVDNDAPETNGRYIELTPQNHHANASWKTSDHVGFAQIKDTYVAGENPFTDGTARYAETVTNENHSSVIQWVPAIPAQGRYAVYVSYQTLDNAIDDARYVVYHKGGKTEFSVNQQMGAGTWVYLGTFEFDEGQHEQGMVTLSNHSRHHGVVSADAVRFGGGMGNIAVEGTKSGLPRWAEGARYASQWAGMRDSTYNYFNNEDDYKSDIQTRPRVANELAGGSVYAPDLDGRRVPVELNVAFHSDAGYSKIDALIGSLSICTTDIFDEKCGDNLSRYTSRDLADLLLANLYTDLRKYKWQVRRLFNRNYGETREVKIPGVLLEMLSHQNFADMRLGFDPQFKFDFSRSVYKTITQYLATMHNRSYVIQPLPVRQFAIQLDEAKSIATLSWQPTKDELDPSADATHYVVYTRMNDGDFDNGTVINSTSCTVRLEKDQTYSFRICALNAGGKSFPSETLSARIASQNEGTVLIVNGFTRLSGPSSFNTATEQGFTLDEDPGVPYGAFAGFCGAQQVFTKSTMGSESATGLGYSGTELEGKVVMGNTFDYTYLHGQGIALNGRHSFTSCSMSAFTALSAHELQRYRMLDVIYGVQLAFDTKAAGIIDTYCRQGGRLLVSGANLLNRNALPSSLLKATLIGQQKDKNIDALHGCGLKFTIHRALNEQSYAVPQVEALTPDASAFAMLAYSTGHIAATAYDGNDYKVITCGFPLESITDANNRNQLMSAIVKFLCK